MRKVDTPQRYKHVNKKIATNQICAGTAGAFTLDKAAKNSCAGGQLFPNLAQSRGKEKFESTKLSHYKEAICRLQTFIQRAIETNIILIFKKKLIR